jgi:2-oxoglutarate ferredoxin oxidoreductase subunit gamma
MRYAEIRLSGAGGQGLGLGGRILAETAINDGYNVCQTQSYGPEARGGASRTDVIVSKTEILYPICRNLDVLLAMNQQSADKFGPFVKEDGFSLVDSTFVDQPPEGTVYEYSFTQVSKDTFGTPLAANMIALGMMGSLTSFFGLDAWRESITKIVAKRFKEMNLDAFEVGHRQGREVLHVKEGRVELAHDRKEPVPEWLKKIRDRQKK